MFDFEHQLKILPDKPGVYIMKNSLGEVIYVGKAKILKNRVRQYFQNSKNHSVKVKAMVKNISEFEYIVTDSEMEALILEGNLIKKYNPKYNIALKDDKFYPFIKIDEYDRMWQKIEKLVNEDIVEISTTNTSKKISEIKPLPMPTHNEFFERVITTGTNFAYLKIGEGCSNRCTYCAIPYIRGPFVSRPKEEIIEEAKILANKGVKEIIIIAQDTTKYGVDIYGEPKLAELLQQISEIPEIKWIRFLYSYPEGITDELIQTVKNNEKICKYFDIPIQHISDTILKKMNRRTNKHQIENLLEKLRKEIPDVTLRTSLFVGFTGETQKDFEELSEFVRIAKFDKLGAFMYSKEEGTPAAKLPEQIHGNTKKSRYNKIMEIQQRISNENLKNKIGQEFEVLIEDISFDGKYLIGRTKQDVPDIDGIVYVKNLDKTSLINKFVRVHITDVKNYDLIGKIIE